MSDGTLDMRDVGGAQNSPLAQALFAIDGVSGVFYGAEFIAVTKSSQEWQHLKPAILGAIMEHFVSCAPLLTSESVSQPSAEQEEFFAEGDAQTVDTIKELLETRIRPAVAGDGGDITFRGFRDGIVYLHMKGACAGCPSSTATLKHGIQNLFRHFLPEVTAVEQI